MRTATPTARRVSGRIRTRARSIGWTRRITGSTASAPAGAADLTCTLAMRCGHASGIPARSASTTQHRRPRLRPGRLAMRPQVIGDLPSAQLWPNRALWRVASLWSAGGRADGRLRAGRPHGVLQEFTKALKAIRPHRFLCFVVRLARPGRWSKCAKGEDRPLRGL